MPSGKQTVLSNRTQRAKSYIAKASLLRITGRGRFVATQRGQNRPMTMRSTSVQVTWTVLGR
ncbi:hypothetical protein HQ394_14495 [Defluviicoccus vanus]|uniref:Uncharacterized protein n=1 Tax=Defluviicoccus vanus TaxID=111831 RepID=A0A7H1N3N4_9PROT|nr:hypothetical protein HQ394_14495 [Defluviicoccus vanus]